MRQSLRTYLDDIGYFANQEAIQQIEDRELATLRRADWQALAMGLGLEQLKTLEQSRLEEIEPATRDAILVHFRSRGWFLDEARKADFRQRGVAALSEAEQQKALAHAREADLQRIKDAHLADLSKPTQWEIEYLAIGAGEEVDYQTSKELEAGTLAQLSPAVLDSFLRYLGYPHSRELLGQRLAALDPDTRKVMRDYLGDRVALELQKRVMLSFVSRLWIDYLTDMENLRQGIGLEAFGQRDPLVEYKRRAYQMFQQLMEDIRQGIVSRVFALEPVELQMDAGR
jgi:preprotein translocase subunit SecA